MKYGITLNFFPVPSRGKLTIITLLRNNVDFSLMQLQHCLLMRAIIITLEQG